MIRTKFLPLLLLLGACSTPPSVPTPVETTAPVQVESQEFACEQLRSGATVQELLDHELARGVKKDDAYNYIITSVNQTCPEFFILIEEHFGPEGEMI